MDTVAVDVPEDDHVIEHEIVEHVASIAPQHLLHAIQRHRLRGGQLAQLGCLLGHLYGNGTFLFFEPLDLLFRGFDFRRKPVAVGARAPVKKVCLCLANLRAQPLRFAVEFLFFGPRECEVFARQQICHRPRTRVFH